MSPKIISSFKRLVTFLAILILKVLLQAIPYMFLSLAFRLFAQAHLFHVPLQGVVILVLLTTNITHAIITPLMEIFHMIF